MKNEKIFNKTDTIFHYTKLETAFEYILKNKQLRFTKYKDSKDPHESRLRKFALTTSETITWPQFDKKLIKINNDINKIIQNRLRITCFCKNKENYSGYFRSRMWSQYADNHRGVCLAFSKKALQNAIKKQFSSVFIKDEEVDYDVHEDIRFDKMYNHQAKTINYTNSNHNTIMKHLNINYKYLFFKKHWDYRDEAEYRIIVYDIDSKYEYLDISDCLVGFILGYRFPVIYLPIVESVESELNLVRDQVHIWDDSNVTLSR